MAEHMGCCVEEKPPSISAVVSAEAIFGRPSTMASTDWNARGLLNSLFEMQRTPHKVSVRKQSALRLIEQSVEADVARQIGASRSVRWVYVRAVSIPTGLWIDPRQQKRPRWEW